MESKRETLAVISDVHSNSIALSAVLQNIQNKNISRIINLGDSLYGPIDPFGTFQLLNNPDITSISGNQDRLILENLDKDSANPTLEFVKNEITGDTIKWLSELPFEIRTGKRIYACHGTPQCDEEYLIEEVKENQVIHRKKDELIDRLRNIQQEIILCGHSHIPEVIPIGEKLVVNAGSVGLQAYEDDLPYFHIMQNHSPHARYVEIRLTEKKYSAEIITVDYDFESAAVRAEMNGRKDWAQYIRTGVAEKIKHD